MADGVEVKVDWYREKVHLVIDKAFKGTAANIANRIEERTKININETPGASGQGLIDTAFMLNSTYVVTPEGSSYDEAWQSGAYTGRDDQPAQRELAPEIALHKYAAAAVVIGANYAIYQEILHGFFMKAIEDTRAEVGGLVQTVGQAEKRL